VFDTVVVIVSLTSIFEADMPGGNVVRFIRIFRVVRIFRWWVPCVRYQTVTNRLHRSPGTSRCSTSTTL